MQITLRKFNSKTKRESYSSIDDYAFLDAVKGGKYELYGSMFRQDYPYMEAMENSRYYNQIPKVIVAAKYAKMPKSDVSFRSYNGIIALKVGGVTENMAMERIKKEAMLLPQTMAAFEGCEGQSVIILCRATLPDGALPKKEADAALFHIKAYRTAVMCYAPMLSRPVVIEEPRLDAAFLMPFDANMQENREAVPFIIQQPDAMEVKRLVDARTPANVLAGRQKEARGGVTVRQIFNGCYQRVRESMSKEEWLNPEASLTRLCHECAEVGIPEEEATRLLLFHYYKMNNQDVRSTVRAVYEGYYPLCALTPGLPKKQIASIRIKEFLERRYELRRNEVTGLTEYRVRNGLDFCFHELTKYDKNTIKYEAALEGIEAFDAEINGFIESNYTPVYNPVTDYIENLGKWDGVDRIGALADMVPTQNPHWHRLFRRWFLSMVAHWMDIDSEHGNNTAPILIGKQGYRKSTFCRILLPPELRSFFTDSVDFRTKQEAERYLTRFLLINIDEFDQLSETQFAFVKHLFQKPNVAMRRMYSEAISHSRRYASFIGTSNHQEVLRDPTGNRRYLCVEVTAPIHTETPIEYAQLYAEAVALIRQGERYWLDDEDEALLRETNRTFESQSGQEIVLRDTFRPAMEGESGAQLLKLTEVLTAMQQHKAFDRKTMSGLVTLGRTMNKLGYTSKRKADGTYYWVAPL